MDSVTNRFVAIDVETANADMSSICQIGIAQYEDGNLVGEWSSLINPNTYFSPMNISIHGIKKEDVKNSPRIGDVLGTLNKFMGNTISVSHTHFDRVSIKLALDKNRLPGIETTWLDSAMVARRTWKEVSMRGYGLANLCEKIGYEFKHHDALEDAKACAQVLFAAISETGLDIDAWLKRIKYPIAPSIKYGKKAREANPEGDLYGEIVVFTGALEIPRREAVNLAAIMGCCVASGVTKKTSLLVVGDQDIQKLNGKEKSSKHVRAEELIKQGQEIRIIKESDFKELMKIIDEPEVEDNEMRIHGTDPDKGDFVLHLDVRQVRLLYKDFMKIIDEPEVEDNEMRIHGTDPDKGDFVLHLDVRQVRLLYKDFGVFLKKHDK